jgi:outer membrane protein assembly factor BamB
MDHYLYAVDMQSGSQIWKTEDLGGSLVGTPAVSPDGVLYVGTFNSEMRAIDAKTGKTTWKAATTGWVWGGPALKDQTLYFGDLSGTFYAMDRSNGKINWQQKLDGTITESPLLTDDTIYISTETGGLYALDYNGKTRWSKTIGANGAGKLYNSPKLANNLILVAPVGTSELLFAFDPAGNQKSTYTPAKK